MGIRYNFVKLHSGWHQISVIAQLTFQHHISLFSQNSVVFQESKPQILNFAPKVIMLLFTYFHIYASLSGFLFKILEINISILCRSPIYANWTDIQVTIYSGLQAQLYSDQFCALNNSPPQCLVNTFKIMVCGDRQPTLEANLVNTVSISNKAFLNIAIVLPKCKSALDAQ